MSRRRYSVVREYGDRSRDDFVPDAIQSSPHALIVVWPFSYRQTFSRALGTSFSTDVSEAIETGGPIFIYSAIKNLSVSENKSSYLGRAQASLRPDQPWADIIMPGDHCAMWICHSEDEILAIVDGIKNKYKVNHWWSGFKFLGRIDNVDEDVTVIGGTGLKSANYNITATSFRELASSVYYNPQLAPNITAVTLFFERIGKGMLQFITAAGDRANISVDKALPYILDLMTIDGISENLKSFVNTPELKFLYGSKALLIPQPVADILGAENNNPDGITRYGNTIKLLHGVQKYAEYRNPDSGFGALFYPTDAAERENRINTGIPLLGKMTAKPPDLFNKPIFQILHEYLNPGCNEMFTTFRADRDGYIHPTIVARQYPFSSSVSAIKAAVLRTTDIQNRLTQVRLEVETEFKEDNEETRNLRFEERARTEVDALLGGKTSGLIPTLTMFRELPRWVIHPMMVKGNFKISRTDAERVNYIQWTGQITDGAQGADFITTAKQLINAPPPMDVLDVSRSGLYPNIRSISASLADVAFGGPAIWQAIAADMYMGAHLLLRGQLTTVGIQAPIPIGDNLEIGNRLFHIESVAHHFNASPDGRTSFSTSLGLTHGVDANAPEDDEQLGWAVDGRENQPGITVDGKHRR